MKIIRYRDQQGREHHGCELQPDVVRRIDGNIFGDHRVTDEPADVAKLLTPVVPTQILGIGLNYRHHAQEAGMKVPEWPVLFVKGINTIQHPHDPILLPARLTSTQVDYECELAVVIARACRNVSREHAFEYVLGYTCANDVSARDWQIKFGGGQWCRGKFFDTFCPLGPRLVTSDEIPDPNALRIATRLNGDVVQDWNTNDMIFDVAKLIEFLSASTTLPAGTVILTGTPHGVGMAAKPQPRFLRSGDRIEIEIEKIGVLANSVAPEMS